MGPPLGPATLGQLPGNLLSDAQPINGRGDNSARVPAALAARVEPLEGDGLEVLAAGNAHRRAGAALDADELALLADEAAHLAVEHAQGLLEGVGEARG